MSRSVSNGAVGIIFLPSAVGEFPTSLLSGDPWNFVIGRNARVLERLQKLKPCLGDVACIFVGLQTSADSVFVVPNDAGIERGLTRPFLLTGELCAFDTPVPSARIIFPYDLVGGKALLMEAERMERDFPRGWAYLCERREELCKRERGKWPADRWYAFGRSQNLTQMDTAKLIIQVTARRPTVLLDETGLSMTGGGSGPFYGIRPKDATFPMKYLLALLNSSLFGAMVRAQSTNLRGGYIKYSKQYIETAPVIRPAEAGPENVAGLIARVDQLIALRRQLAAPGAPHEIENRRNQLAALTAALDALVGQVYGLTPEERAAFEAS